MYYDVILFCNICILYAYTKYHNNIIIVYCVVRGAVLCVLVDPPAFSLLCATDVSRFNT